MGLLPFVVAIGVGCEGLGSGSFDGTVDGHTLRVEETIFVPLEVGQGPALGAIVILVDVPDICSSVQAHTMPSNATIVEFALIRRSEDGNPEPTDNGTYAVSADFFAPASIGRLAAGIFAKLDTNGTNIVAGGAATSGTVKVDSIELEAGGSLIGTFDAIFGTQAEQANGTFKAKYCEATGSL